MLFILLGGAVVARGLGLAQLAATLATIAVALARLALLAGAILAGGRPRGPRRALRPCRVRAARGDTGSSFSRPTSVRWDPTC